MSNHTPGPWIGIDPKTKMFRSSKGWSVDKERCSHMSAPISAKGGPVCFVVTDDWEKKAELHANAQLIAAAPEMLGILQYIEGRIPSGDTKSIAQIRAVISKATGETA
mgnify:CR=1 FL=1